MVDVGEVGLFDLLEATGDDEDARLAGRLRGVVDSVVDPDTLHQSYNNGLSPQGYPWTINVTDPHPDISGVKALGDGTTDDTTAIQNCLDWQHDNDFGYELWFPNVTPSAAFAAYMISAPLKVYGNARIRGPAQIKALATFDFTANTNTAMMELYSTNNTRYGLGRLIIYDLVLDCNGVANSRGFLWNLQQPSIMTKLRVNNFTDTGGILAGQQAQFYETMFIGPAGADSSVGLTLESGCKFMTFEGFNVEGCEVAVFHDADGPNWFKSVHIETNNTDHPNAVGFDLDRGGIWVQNGWVSFTETTQTLFRAGNNGNAASKYYYVIQDFRLSNSVDVKAIDDKARSISLDGWTDFRRHIQYFNVARTSTAASYTQPNIWTLWGDDGRVVKLGGMEPADPSALWQAGTSQTADMAQWNDSGGTKRFSIDDTAHPILPSYTDANRPVATTVPAGAVVWNTDDNAPNYSDGTNWRTAAGATT